MRTTHNDLRQSTEITLDPMEIIFYIHTKYCVIKGHSINKKLNLMCMSFTTNALRQEDCVTKTSTSRDTNYLLEK